MLNHLPPFFTENGNFSIRHLWQAYISDQGLADLDGGHACVILAPSIVGLLVHEAIGHTVEADFVQAGKALGAGDRRIVTRHMIPSSMAPVVVAATLGIADSVVIEAALSYLGFGITPPEASLGNMLTKAQDYFYRDPLLAWYPGVTLVLVVLAASFLGDGLRDALDPRQRIETN